MLQKLVEALRKLWNLIPPEVQVIILYWTNQQLYRLMQVVSYQINLRRT